MNIKKEICFWSKILNMPRKQFTKPYIKKNFLKNINYKGGFGHGTCNACVDNARLSEKIIMAMKVIGDKYNKISV